MAALSSESKLRIVIYFLLGIGNVSGNMQEEGLQRLSSA